jgi:hypothetical protein
MTPCSPADVLGKTLPDYAVSRPRRCQRCENFKPIFLNLISNKPYRPKVGNGILILEQTLISVMRVSFPYNFHSL